MGMGQATKRVADMVREMIPRFRYSLSPQEKELGVHLRGNEALLNSLVGMIDDRIKGREFAQLPSDPIVCMVHMARDKELRWLLSRLEYIYGSPVASEATDGEQPE